MCGHLIISEGNGMPSGEDVGSTQWLKLFRPFTHVRELCVSEQLVPDIVQALPVAPGVLPELIWLHLNGHRNSPSVEDAVEPFVSARGLTGRTITLLDGEEPLNLLKNRISCMGTCISVLSRILPTW
jgi:hypothetical protein